MFIQSTLTTVNESQNRHTVGGYLIDVKHYANNPSAIALQLKDPKTGNAVTTLTTNMSNNLTLMPYAHAYIDSSMPQSVYSAMISDGTMSQVMINNQPVVAAMSDGFNSPLMKFNKEALKRLDPEGMRIYTNAYTAMKENQIFSPNFETDKLIKESLTSYGYTNEMFSETDYDEQTASEPVKVNETIEEIEDRNAFNLLKLKNAGAYSQSLKDIMSMNMLMNEKTTFSGYYSPSNEYEADNESEQYPTITHQGNTPDGELLIGDFVLDDEEVKYRGVPSPTELTDNLIRLYQSRAINEAAKGYDISQPIVTNGKVEKIAEDMQCIVIDKIEHNSDTNDMAIKAIAVNGQDIVPFAVTQNGETCIHDAFESMTKSYDGVPIVMTNNTPITEIKDNKQSVSHFSSNNYNAGNPVENVIAEYDGNNEIIAMKSANAIGFDTIRAIAHKTAENKMIPNAKSTTIYALYTAFAEYDVEMKGSDSVFAQEGNMHNAQNNFYVAENQPNNYYTPPTFAPNNKPQVQPVSAQSQPQSQPPKNPVKVYLEDIPSNCLIRSRSNQGVISVDISNNKTTGDKMSIVTKDTNMKSYPDTDKRFMLELDKDENYTVVQTDKNRKRKSVQMTGQEIKSMYDSSDIPKKNINKVPDEQDTRDKSMNY